MPDGILVDAIHFIERRHPRQLLLIQQLVVHDDDVGLRLALRMAQFSDHSLSSLVPVADDDMVLDVFRHLNLLSPEEGRGKPPRHGTKEEYTQNEDEDGNRPTGPRHRIAVLETTEQIDGYGPEGLRDALEGLVVVPLTEEHGERSDDIEASEYDRESDVNVLLGNPADRRSVLDGIPQHDEARAPPENGRQVVGQVPLQQSLLTEVCSRLRVDRDDRPHLVIQNAIEPLIRRETVPAQIRPLDAVLFPHDVLFLEDQFGDGTDEVRRDISAMGLRVFKTLARHENRTHAHRLDRFLLAAVGVGGNLRVYKIGKGAHEPVCQPLVDRNERYVILQRDSIDGLRQQRGGDSRRDESGIQGVGQQHVPGLGELASDIRQVHRLPAIQGENHRGAVADVGRRRTRADSPALELVKMLDPALLRGNDLDELRVQRGNGQGLARRQTEHHLALAEVVRRVVLHQGQVHLLVVDQSQVLQGAGRLDHLDLNRIRVGLLNHRLDAVSHRIVDPRPTSGGKANCDLVRRDGHPERSPKKNESDRSKPAERCPAKS